MTKASKRHSAAPANAGKLSASPANAGNHASAPAAIDADNDPLLMEAETAEVLAIKPQTLAVWRTTKRYALPYIKVGRSVRYKRSDVLAFLESRRVQP